MASAQLRRDLALENLALRYQIGVLKRTVGKGRLRLGPVDRGFWAGLSRIRVGWEQALAIVQPATVIRWRREGLRILRRTRPLASARRNVPAV